MIDTRVLLVAEFQLDLPDDTPPEIVEREAQQRMDAFREAVQCANEYGIFLYRAPEAFNRKDYL
jgi:hypothetical protein